MRKLAQLVVADAVLPILSRWDPERAHDWGFGLAVLAAASGRSLAVPPGLGSCVASGLEFAHPLGLAAGFDKNGDYLDALGALGFSHVELGTVTPRPQPGNPKPRMFRAPGRRPRQPHGVQQQGRRSSRRAPRAARAIAGFAASASARTPTRRSSRRREDYLACLRKVYPLADYVAVNVSSPNTARLRELQAPDGLSSIVGPLLEERARLEATPRTARAAAGQDRAGSRLLADQRDRGEPALARSRRRDRHQHHHRSRGAGRRLAGRPARRLVGRAPARPLGGRHPAIARRARQRAFPSSASAVSSMAGGPAATLRAGADLMQVYTGFAVSGSRASRGDIGCAFTARLTSSSSNSIATARRICRGLFEPERDRGAARRHRLESRAR